MGLSIDRTNWKFGKHHINILIIGVALGKIAIPIVWKVLPQTTKKGNSNTKHRIAIFNRLLRLMKAGEIFVLIMDREFGGREWLKYLDEKGVGYIVRIKANTIVGTKPAHGHATTRKGGKAPVRIEVWSMNLFFANKVIRSKGRRDTHFHVLSNRFSGNEALELYKLRWGIEQLFSHLKKRGFNLEDTHMTDAGKLEKLFALITLAFLYSYAWGCQLRTAQKATQAMKRKSLFRQGLEDILRLLNNPPSQTRRAGGFL